MGLLSVIKRLIANSVEELSLSVRAQTLALPPGTAEVSRAHVQPEQAAPSTPFFSFGRLSARAI